MKLIFATTFILLASSSDASSILKGGAIGIHDDNNGSMINRFIGSFSGSGSGTRSSSPTTVYDPKAGEKPMDDMITKAIKQMKGRRRCELRRPSGPIWTSMNGLKSDESYTIKMYRESRNHANIIADFPWTPDNFRFSDSARHRNLVQTFYGEDNSKRLCIFTPNDINNLPALEAFTKKMISFKNDEEEKERIFRYYKQQLGLPTVITNFEYIIYAWVTDSDCSFYNLGAPKFINTPYGSSLQSFAPSEAYSESSSTTNKVYAVQISKPKLQKRKDVTVMQVMRSDAETCSLRGNQFATNYNDISELFKAIHYPVIGKYQFGQKCAALFTDGSNSSKAEDLANFFKNAVDQYSRGTIDTVRALVFENTRVFDNVFGILQGSTAISFAYWDSYMGECIFPIDFKHVPESFHEDRPESSESKIPAKKEKGDSDDEF